MESSDSISGVVACLLDHYLTCYGGSKDALAFLAEHFVPDWQSRCETFDPSAELKAAISKREAHDV